MWALARAWGMEETPLIFRWTEAYFMLFLQVAKATWL